MARVSDWCVWRVAWEFAVLQVLRGDANAGWSGITFESYCSNLFKQKSLCLLFYSGAFLPSGLPRANRFPFFLPIGTRDENLCLIFLSILAWAPAQPNPLPAPAFLSNLKKLIKLHSRGPRKKLSGHGLPKLIEWSRHFSQRPQYTRDSTLGQFF